MFDGNPRHGHNSNWHQNGISKSYSPKALYCMKQPHRLWNKRLDEAILKFGLKPISADTCIFLLRVNKREKSIKVWSSIPTTKTIQWDQRSPGSIKSTNIHQEQGLANCNPKSTPTDHGPEEWGREEEEADHRLSFGRGRLLYLATMTRPDISYAVSQVTEYCEIPQSAHWNAVKRIFAYQKGTCDYKLWLGRSDEWLAILHRLVKIAEISGPDISTLASPNFRFLEGCVK